MTTRMHAARPRERLAGVIFVVAIVASAVAFLVAATSTLLDLARASAAIPFEVDRDVTAIAHASIVRSDLQDIEQLLSEAMEGHPWEPGAMRHLLQAADRERSLVQAAYAGDDSSQQTTAFGAIAKARGSVEIVRTALDTGSRDQARAAMHDSLRPLFRDADAGLALLLESSMRELRRAASAQQQRQYETVRKGLALDGIFFLIAVSLAAVGYGKSNRQRRRLAGQIAELETFADRVAHDIRGPLMPVLFALEQARQEVKPPFSQFMERGERSLAVVVDIVDGLLAFARSGSRPEPGAHTDVQPVLDNVVAACARDAEVAGIDLEIGPANDASVACARGVLASILSNLVSNGIRYMSDRPPRRVAVRVGRVSDQVILTVSDTGPGLPAGFEERVFSPYERPAGQLRSGLGLGLATVKRLADAHGGSVTVGSTPRGCSFVVTLPSWRPPQGGAATDERTASAAGMGASSH